MLFGGGTTEVDARGLDAFVTHEVCKQCEIVEAIEEVFGKTMSKGMGIDYGGVDSVFLGKQFELLSYSTGSYPFSETVEKNIT